MALHSNRTVRIYNPAKTAMQSGVGNTKKWVLEFLSENMRYIDPLMGWTASKGTLTQIKMWFSSSRRAVAYAKKNNLDYTMVQGADVSAKNPKSYADNFLRPRDL